MNVLSLLNQLVKNKSGFRICHKSHETNIYKFMGLGCEMRANCKKLMIAETNNLMMGPLIIYNFYNLLLIHLVIYFIRANLVRNHKKLARIFQRPFWAPGVPLLQGIKMSNLTDAIGQRTERNGFKIRIRTATCFSVFLSVNRILNPVTYVPILIISISIIINYLDY